MFRTASAITIVTLITGTAIARPEIGPGAFTPAATLIDFDDLVGGQTIQTGDLVNTQ